MAGKCYPVIPVSIAFHIFHQYLLRIFKVLKTGNGLFRIDFLNVAYAEGMQDFSMEMRVLKRAKDYLVGEIVEVQSVNPARCTIISNIEWRWLQRFCPELLVRHPLLSSSDPSSESLNRCLNEVFRQKPLLKNNGLVRTCYYSGCDYSSITEAFSR